MEAVSARKNGRERGRHARGEEFRRLMRKVRASFWTEGNAFHKIINQPTDRLPFAPRHTFSREYLHTPFSPCLLRIKVLRLWRKVTNSDFCILYLAETTERIQLGEADIK